MMKTLFLCVIFPLSIGVSTALGQEGIYEPDLAKKLKADDIGMKKYVVAFLY